ncbi:MAG: hypothetical protein HeimC3_52760 [Candidatus Heimdallarchaeota archaeon LC_3]|nr:MAG: hypothetical protein HeimC3_52760 [Candidatus Heimdallarchaeota archaeon LC_3]
MTSYDKKLKKSYAGEDIAGIFEEEEAAKERTFKKQKSKNSQLLANFRTKMSEIRTNENEMDFKMESDLENSLNMGEDDRLVFEDEKPKKSEIKTSGNSKSDTKRKFSLKRPFFSRNNASKKPKNQQRRKKTANDPQYRRNKRY